ncbi:MAG: hypothetical protein ACRD0W_00265 [Acidimicrobiales bacterium]
MVDTLNEPAGQTAQRVVPIKDQILAADDLPFEDLKVPEWGVELRVRGLTGTDRDAYEARAVAVRNAGQDVELRLSDFRSRLVIKCLYDPATDERLFADSEVSALGAKSGVVIERLFKIAQRLSGMDSAALGRAEGNSETDRSDVSTTD